MKGNLLLVTRCLLPDTCYLTLVSCTFGWTFISTFIWIFIWTFIWIFIWTFIWAFILNTYMHSQIIIYMNTTMKIYINNHMHNMNIHMNIQNSYEHLNEHPTCICIFKWTMIWATWTFLQILIWTSWWRFIQAFAKTFIWIFIQGV